MSRLEFFFVLEENIVWEYGTLYRGMYSIII